MCKSQHQRYNYDGRGKIGGPPAKNLIKTSIVDGGLKNVYIGCPDFFSYLFF
tara:strand:- start:1159 stop:1314 length:156 start_codon:yes stop_codon:yes gene_type:complete